MTLLADPSRPIRRLAVAQRSLLLFFALGAAACQPLAPAKPASQPEPSATVVSELYAPGFAFARISCGGCHALQAQARSPHPDAPTFPAIANRKGMTRERLTGWLRSPH